jgi:hypothetical protein
MFFLIPLLLFGWLPFVIFLYWCLPPRRALVISFITAYLFLPVYDYVLPGLPFYGKTSATCYATVIAVLFYDIKCFKSFAPSLIDLPMMFWCTAPFIASMSNGLGPYDGFRAASERIALWLVPYFFGRVYLNSLSGLRELAIGIFAGGLLYAPLCLLEFKISPILHARVYGISVSEHAWGQSIRKGGYRPILFTVHGLSVALWMMAATLIGVWLWQSGSLRRFWNISMKWLVPPLLFIMVLIQSTGALMCVILGLVALFTAKWLRTSMVVLLLIGMISSYLYVATTGSFNGDQVISAVSTAINPDRAESLQFRLDQEKGLVVKARQRMIFGWAGWGRSRIFNEWGRDISVTDSWWVIVFGTTGIYGVVSGTMVLLLPTALFTYYYPARTWSHPKVAPAAAIAVILVNYMIDNLANAIAMPVLFLAVGGLSGLIAKEVETNHLGKDGIALSVADNFLPESRQSQHDLLTKVGSDDVDRVF